MKRIKNAAKYSLYILSVFVLLSCSSNAVNRKKLSDKSHIMTDENGNKWIIKHHIGDTYIVEFYK